VGVQIQAKLRKDDQDYDGLTSIAEELIDKPLKPRTVVARIEVVGYQVNLADGGTRTPKVRIVAIEPLDGELEEQARALLDKAYTGRTGQAAPAPTLFDNGEPDDDDEDGDDEDQDDEEDGDASPAFSG
jgi:hypothetical protein